MFQSLRSRCQKNLTKFWLLTSICFFSTGTIAEEFNFIVQPVMSPEKTIKNYQPLADYLSQHTGHKFNIVAERYFLNYWYKMKKGKYDLILDAAHFTDYRVNHLHYSVLAKLPNTVSFSLITNSRQLIIDPQELVGKTLVTLPPPSIGAVYLQKLYPSATRQPVIVTMKSADEAIEAVQNNKYFAALVPTPLIQGKERINVITTTDPIPHMAFSASEKISPELQQKIKNALINAKNSHTGQLLLRKLGISAFDTTSEKTYEGYEKYLAGMIRSSRIGSARRY